MTTKNQQPKKKDICHGFKVFQQDFVYAVEWYDWKIFFTIHSNKTISNIINILEEKKSNGSLLAIHTWNKMSCNELAFKKFKNNQFYTWLVSSQCPLTYEIAPRFF